MYTSERIWGIGAPKNVFLLGVEKSDLRDWGLKNSKILGIQWLRHLKFTVYPDTFKGFIESGL